MGKERRLSWIEEVKIATEVRGIRKGRSENPS